MIYTSEALTAAVATRLPCPTIAASLRPSCWAGVSPRKPLRPEHALLKFGPHTAAVRDCYYSAVLLLQM